MLALIVDLGTRGADAEIAALQAGTERSFAVVNPRSLRDKAEAAALAMLSSDPDPRSRLIIEQTRLLLQQIGPAATLDAALAPAAPASPARARDAVLGFLQDVASLEPGITRVTRPAAAPYARVLAPPAMAPEHVAAAAGTGAARNASNKSGPFYLADRVAHPRNELMIALAGLPREEDRGDIALFTPALIDFSFWLDPRARDPNDPDPTDAPRDVTPLANQIAVMSSIAALNRTASGRIRPYAVHPFVSFCPWRQIAWELSSTHDPVSQFNLVKQAVQDKGFIGVKLYPLMGFRPTGNAAAPASFYPARLRRLDNWAARLDRALHDLYTWCVAEDVPIMAHCSYSQFPEKRAGTLGSPAAWREVYETLDCGDCA